MKDKSSGFFWPSFTDLMTSLFFIMLVLYVLTYVMLKKSIKAKDEQLAIIHAVEGSLQPLKNDKYFFKYEEEYKRFTLRFDVEFERSKYELADGQLKNYTLTIYNIKEAGVKLKTIIDNLKKEKESNANLKDVSYTLVIAGYASHTGNEQENYQLSYNRAYSLWNYWRKSLGIDFEIPEYNGLIDLQIAGNGWGGVGRIEPDNNEKNQRFIIQIMPKIGDLNQKLRK